MCVLVVVAQVRGNNAASLMTPKSCIVEKVIGDEGGDTGRESTASTTEQRARVLPMPCRTNRRYWYASLAMKTEGLGHLKEPLEKQTVAELHGGTPCAVLCSGWVGGF